jgi:hypothetical protein
MYLLKPMPVRSLKELICLGEGRVAVILYGSPRHPLTGSLPPITFIYTSPTPIAIPPTASYHGHTHTVNRRSRSAPSYTRAIQDCAATAPISRTRISPLLARIRRRVRHPAPFPICTDFLFVNDLAGTSRLAACPCHAPNRAACPARSRASQGGH